MRLRDVSLARKLTSIIMVTTCTALLLASAALAISQWIQFRRTVVRQMTTLAAMVANNETAALIFRDPRTAAEILQSLKAEPDLLRAAVFAANGSVFAEYRRDGRPLPPPARRSDGTYFQDDEVVQYRTVRLNGDDIGIVYLASDLAPARARFAQTLAVGGILILVCSAVAYLLALRLQRMISAPVFSLLAVTNQVAARKDFSIRAPGEANDELGMLVRAFNSMLSDLQTRDLERQRYREHLEDQVEERTRELRRPNNILATLGEAEAGQPSTLTTRHSLPRSGRRLRLLVAEDNTVNQVLIRTLLHKAGHDVVVAENGEQAIEQAARGHFDLILMDVQMPGMDGFATTAAIREQERSSGTRTPIVALTAHALAGYREQCLAAGMDGYLSKPIAFRELLAVLELYGGAMPAAEPSAIPAWDREKALSNTGNDPGLLRELISIFQAEAPRLVQRIQDAVQNGGAGELEHAAHALKGELGCIAAAAAAEQARKLEELARQGDLQDAAASVGALTLNLQLLLQALQDFTAEEHAERSLEAVVAAGSGGRS